MTTSFFERVQPPRPPEVRERRACGRTPRQHRATALIEMLLHDPATAVRTLEHDMRRGTKPAVVLAVVNAAESLARLRHLDLSIPLDAIRKQISARMRGGSVMF